MTEPGGGRLSEELRNLAVDEFVRGRRHPLVRAVSRPEPPPDVFERWLALNIAFLRTFRRVLIVMGSLAPDARAGKVMFDALRCIDLEILEERTYAAEADLDLEGVPSPRAMDFSSYCMASVTQGWVRGLVVMYAVEGLFIDVWTQAREQLPPGHPYENFIHEWSNPAQQRLIASIAALVDQLTPTSELEQIYRRVVRLELASWDEAYGRFPADT